MKNEKSKHMPEILDVMTVSGGVGGDFGGKVNLTVTVKSADSVKSVRDLLAAAPELLAALEWALRNIEEIALPEFDRQGRITSLNNSVVKARAAIAKARGEK